MGRSSEKEQRMQVIKQQKRCQTRHPKFGQCVEPASHNPRDPKQPCRYDLDAAGNPKGQGA